jgi:hypothetical protein
MDQKQWEQRLDRAADRVSQAVGEGVRVLEDAFVKGKATLQEEMDGRRGEPQASPGSPDSQGSQGSPGTAPAPGRPGGAPATKGSPRLGLVLVGLGIVWLLHSLGILDQPVFPILLIVLGVYFIARSK